MKLFPSGTSYDEVNQLWTAVAAKTDEIFAHADEHEFGLTLLYGAVDLANHVIRKTVPDTNRSSRDTKSDIRTEVIMSSGRRVDSYQKLLQL